MRRSCVVVGAGLGGLATAIRLQHRGWQVQLLEKNVSLGGRCNRISADGFTFDTGPTLLLMRDVLDSLFQSVGRRLEDYLELLRVHPNYRIHFGDGSALTFSTDLQELGAQFEAFEAGAGEALLRYVEDAGYKYRVARERFVERNFLRLRDFATLRNLYYLLTTNTLRKLDRHAARYFRDPRLVAALTFQAMYLGLSPARAPAVYSLLPYTELVEGIWFPRGGMYRIVEALAQLAVELGVTIERGVAVRRLVVRGKRVCGVETDAGDHIEAGVVVSNVDLPHTYERLLPKESQSRAAGIRLARLNPGSSAFLLFLGLNHVYPRLNHHNVFLSPDTAGNFRAIFNHGRLPDHPSFYVCAPQRSDPSLVAAGKDALYVLAPVPALSPAVDWDREKDCFKERMYERLTEAGFDDLRRHVVFEAVTTPLDLAGQYSLRSGSAFGISHSFTQVGYMRPANKASSLEGLYFVGASTQPGGGVPMVIIGSRLTAERIARDHLDG